MQTITETDLAYAAEFKVIKSIRIQETASSSYQVYVLTKDDPNEKPLVTLRAEDVPREWVNLDRLVKHIRNKFLRHNSGAYPVITLSLYNEKL